MGCWKPLVTLPPHSFLALLYCYYYLARAFAYARVGGDASPDFQDLLDQTEKETGARILIETPDDDGPSDTADAADAADAAAPSADASAVPSVVCSGACSSTNGGGFRHGFLSLCGLSEQYGVLTHAHTGNGIWELLRPPHV